MKLVMVLALATALGGCASVSQQPVKPVKPVRPASSAAGKAPPSPRAPSSSLHEPPAGADIAAADYGPPPGVDHQSQIRVAMERLLKDPESARYRFAEPARDWLPRYPFDLRAPGDPHQHGYVYGWRVDFTVNAKNGFGGYAGEHRYAAFMQQAQLTAIMEPSRHKDTFGYDTRWWVQPIMPENSGLKRPHFQR